MGAINKREFYEGLDRMFQQKSKTATMNYLEDWLRKAEAAEDTSGIIAVSNELGGLCRAAGETGRAKELYRKVLSRLEDLGLKDTEHYATALVNAGDVYVFTKEPQTALDMFTRARDILVRRGFAGDYRMAALHNNMSMAYRDTGELEKAEKSLNTAFDIIKGIPECRGELATTYINLGELQVRQRKLEMARESFEGACRMFEEDGGTDVHYSSACAGLGQVYYLKGDRENSARCYEKALALIERDFGRTEYYRLVEGNLRKVRDGI